MFEAVTAFFSAIFASAWGIAAVVVLSVALVSATAYGVYSYVSKSRAEAPAFVYAQDFDDIA